MKPLFIDENLPRSLVGRLGTSAVHATQLGVRLSDEEIWARGKLEGGIVLTQDADFFDRMIVDGPPPQVVWVRTGNMRRSAMEDLLVKVWPTVERLLADVALVEVHQDRVIGMVVSP